MSRKDRIYTAACLHIEAFGLELERDGRTMFLGDPRQGITLTTRLPLVGGKQAAIVDLVHQHVLFNYRQEERRSILADLETLHG
jgi:hypothetical protein